MTSNATEVFTRTAEDYAEAIARMAGAPADRRAHKNIVGVFAGDCAIAAACLFLRMHGISITSDTEPHAEMCQFLADLEVQGLAPQGAARIMWAVDVRHANFAPTTHPDMQELQQLVLDLGKRISAVDPATGDRIVKAAEQLARAVHPP